MRRGLLGTARSVAEVSFLALGEEKFGLLLLVHLSKGRPVEMLRTNHGAALEANRCRRWKLIAARLGFYHHC